MDMLTAGGRRCRGEERGENRQHWETAISQGGEQGRVQPGRGMGLAPAGQPGRSPSRVPLDGARAGSSGWVLGLGAPGRSSGWELRLGARARCSGWEPLDGAQARCPWRVLGLGAPGRSQGWEPLDRAQAGRPWMEPGLGAPGRSSGWEQRCWSCFTWECLGLMLLSRF